MCLGLNVGFAWQLALKTWLDWCVTFLGPNIYLVTITCKSDSFDISLFFSQVKAVGFYVNRCLFNFRYHFQIVGNPILIGSLRSISHWKLSLSYMPPLGHLICILLMQISFFLFLDENAPAKTINTLGQGQEPHVPTMNGWGALDEELPMPKLEFWGKSVWRI